jgi:hypothetical protein
MKLSAVLTSSAALISATVLAQNPVVIIKEVTESGKTGSTYNPGSAFIFDARSALTIQVQGSRLRIEQHRKSSLAIPTQDLVADALDLVTELRQLVVEYNSLDCNKSDFSVQKVRIDKSSRAAISGIAQRLQAIRAKNSNIDQYVQTSANAFENYVQTLNAVRLNMEKTIPLYKVQVKAVQTREYRYGRSYPTTLRDFLTISDEDRAALEKLTELSLKEKIKTQLATASKDFDTAWENVKKENVDRINKLRDDTRTAVQNAWAEIRRVSAGTLTSKEQLEAHETAIDNALNAIQNLDQGIGDIAAKLQDSIKNFFDSSVVDAIKNQLVLLGVVNRVDSVASKVLTESLAPDDLIAIGYVPGLQGKKIKGTIDLNFVTNDTLELEVTASIPDQPQAKEPTLKTKAYAFQIGNTMVRTATFNYLPGLNGGRNSSAPSYNFHWKKFGRSSLAANRQLSIGYGLSVFFLGGNQDQTNGSQTILGPSISLFDDWVTLGYAHNFSLGKGTPFIGVMVPFRF